MKKIKLLFLFISAIFAIINLVACSGGVVNNSSSNPPIVYQLPNGSKLIVPVSSISAQVGNNTTTSITIMGGSPNLSVGLSSSAANLATNSNAKVSNYADVLNPINVNFNPAEVISGTNNNTSTIDFNISYAAVSGKYQVNLFATYTYDGVTTTNKIGVVTLSVNSDSGIKAGVLNFIPESINVLSSYPTNVVLSLDNSSGVSNLIVNLVNSESNVTQIFPSQCSLSTEFNYCTVTITGESLGIATISSVTAGYESATIVASIPYGFSGPFFMASDNTYSNLLVTNFAPNGYSGAVSTCKISNGCLNSCRKANIDIDLAMGIAINNSGDRAYFTSIESVVACKLANGDLSDCVSNDLNTESTLFFTSITLNKQNNYAYLAAFSTNESDGIYRCNVNDQILNNCQNIYVYPTYFPTSITFDQDESVVYINNLYRAITQCNASSGYFESCFFYLTPPEQTMAGSLMFSPNYSYIYMTVFNSSTGSHLAACDLESSTGVIQTCQNTGSSGIMASIGLAFAESSANHIFVTDFESSRIVGCSMSSPTTASSCLPTGTP